MREPDFVVRDHEASCDREEICQYGDGWWDFSTIAVSCAVTDTSAPWWQAKSKTDS